VANLPSASTTLAANCACVNYTGGKFATGTAGVVDTGSKLPPVSMIPVANNGNNKKNIILLTHYSELEGKNVSIC
jgi:hypothetical protein